MDAIVLFSIIIVAASILQTSTGFGFSIMATPFLLLLFEPKEAIQINLILSLVISLALIRKVHQDVDMTILKRFIIGSFSGLVLGIIIFLYVNTAQLKLVVSLVILLLTFLLILSFRVKQTKERDFFVGGISGALTTSIGMPGPPLLLYFSGTGASKEKIRATTLAFYLFIYTASLAVQIVFAGSSQTIWVSSALAFPLVIIGLIVGQKLFVRVSQRLFRVFTYIILLFTGFYLLLERLI
ncbi:sulfite exporter TauE/SafE family protein [Halobacillus shinanisalinarum]|uniref:Probable membrane transporter protein n=1 Tax=Halobacillus shinanisalinarum TaxID=2932258 RepID=A0ABY4H4J6_9BACI|nr:sulfite exporter TauE/SafE family protein [Halobacillus shinanisalinarum]UOQ95383.1 sulfite exporter TauE/SafE family protein [Halobacillus shinanisalinarum]